MTRMSESAIPIERRALVVDDDSFACTLVAHAVETLGYQVQVAGSGGDALRLLDDFDPDIALVDLDLGPGPTGYDVVREIRARAPWTAAVIMSSHRCVELVVADAGRLPSHCEFLCKRDLTSTADFDSAIKRALDNAPAPAADSGLPAITASQASLLRMIAIGLSNSEIAQQRGITAQSVERMSARLYRSLGLTGKSESNPRVEAARVYNESGVVVRPRGPA